MNKELVAKVIGNGIKIGIIYYIIVAISDSHLDKSEAMIAKASSLAKGKEIGDIVDIVILKKFLRKVYAWEVKQYSIVDIVDGKYVVKYCGTRPVSNQEKEEINKKFR